MKEIIKSRIFVITGLIRFFFLVGETTGMKTWSYELKSITSETSDPEKLDIHLEIARVTRGVYAISGTFLINYDIVAGDTNNIAAKSYRSAQGDDDFKVLPFQMSETHFYQVLNTHYKNVLMDTIRDCSNLPVFEDKFEPPLEKTTYIFNACQFSQDGLPNHLQEGLYKLYIIGTGEVDWQVVVIAEVTPNI